MLGAINHVAISVVDLKKSDDFWSPIMDFLGYEKTEQFDELSIWESKTTGSAINFWKAKEDGEYKRYAPGLHHLAFNASSKEDVDSLYALLQKLDVEILDAPATYNDYEPGYYAVFFKDVNGFKIELAYTPSIAGSAIGSEPI